MLEAAPKTLTRRYPMRAFGTCWEYSTVMPGSARGEVQAGSYDQPLSKAAGSRRPCSQSTAQKSRSSRDHDVHGLFMRYGSGTGLPLSVCCESRDCAPNRIEKHSGVQEVVRIRSAPVSYTHLTLPTNREV